MTFRFWLVPLFLLVILFSTSFFAQDANRTATAYRTPVPVGDHPPPIQGPGTGNRCEKCKDIPQKIPCSCS